jgi:cytochrome c553
MPSSRRLGGLLALLAASFSAQANPPAVARDTASLQVTVWAASCMACHGAEGHAQGGGLTIGGRPADELRKLLLAFKRGTLKATVMHQHTKGYSDDELGRIADYFATLK